MIQKRQIRRIMVVFLLAVFFSSLILLIFFSFYFVKTMPDKPQPEFGRTTPFDVHGWVVYITKRQSLFIESLFWLGMCLPFIGLAIIRILDIYHRKYRSSKLQSGR